MKKGTYPYSVHFPELSPRAKEGGNTARKGGGLPLPDLRKLMQSVAGEEGSEEVPSTERGMKKFDLVALQHHYLRGNRETERGLPGKGEGGGSGKKREGKGRKTVLSQTKSKPLAPRQKGEEKKGGLYEYPLAKKKRGKREKSKGKDS